MTTPSVMRLSDYEGAPRFHATVLSSARITAEASDEEVRELVLELDHPGFSCQVGQSIGVFAPGRQDLGQAHHFRLYSIAGRPARSTVA